MRTPNPDGHSELREALQRDAARIQEPPFDVALHHATIRRIRALADSGPVRSGRWLIPTLAAAGVALSLMIAAAITHREPSRPRPDVAAALASSQNSIARLSVETPTLFPAWASPTASILEQPQIPQ